MDNADSISRFFSNSPKRQLVFEKWVTELYEGEKRQKLKSLCKTRWVERHEAFEVFVDLFVPLVCCLEQIKDSRDFNRDSRADAQSFFLSLCHFPFIAILVIATELLGYTKALSVKLQGRYVDVVRANRVVSLVKSALQRNREAVDLFHNRVYKKAIQIATMVNVEESAPRTTGRQTHRSNVPASCPSEYYCRLITIPMVDHLISEMNSRFNSQTSTIITEIMLLLPSEQFEREKEVSSSVLASLEALYMQ